MYLCVFIILPQKIKLGNILDKLGMRLKFCNKNLKGKIVILIVL